MKTATPPTVVVVDSVNAPAEAGNATPLTGVPSATGAPLARDTRTRTSLRPLAGMISGVSSIDICQLSDWPGVTLMATEVVTEAPAPLAVEKVSVVLPAELAANTKLTIPPTVVPLVPPVVPLTMDCNVPLVAGVTVLLTTVPSATFEPLAWVTLTAISMNLPVSTEVAVGVALIRTVAGWNAESPPLLPPPQAASSDTAVTSKRLFRMAANFMGCLRDPGRFLRL